ncbi:MAG: winged helix-turn-helix transcriptional regulator [Arcobacter sp.]|nr:winged helix-turn-helix transcriptional regulator [Arcobacter sp.]
MINREVFAEVPPKVVNSLSESGKKLKPVLEEMYKWSIDYVETYVEVTGNNKCNVKI